jgi:predicted RNA-binding protein with PUA-like domain
MNVFLAKTDPDTYSLNDFEQEGETLWDGVHSHAAINVIKTMRPGDKVYIYHSQSDKAILGIAEVTGEPSLNTADTRFSWVVTMKFIRRLAEPIKLAEIKAAEACSELMLVRQPQLSTMPVPPRAEEWLAAHSA